MSSVIAKIKQAEEEQKQKDIASSKKLPKFMRHVTTFLTIVAHNLVLLAIYGIIMAMVVMTAISLALYGAGFTVSYFGATAMASVADVVVIYGSAITVSGFVLFFSCKLLNWLFKQLGMRLWRKDGFDVIKPVVNAKQHVISVGELKSNK